MLCFTSQGADGVRGLKGSKGEKVSDILLFWCRTRVKPANYNSMLQFVIDCFHYILSLLNVPQGEDGFPGAKGDMGIKGDRVSTAEPHYKPYKCFHLDIHRLKITFPFGFLCLISSLGWWWYNRFSRRGRSRRAEGSIWTLGRCRRSWGSWWKGSI